MVYDVCIVGTGLWGSAAARHATKSGRKVCLIGPREPTEKERPSRDIFSSHYDAGRNVRKYQGTDHIRSLLTMRTLESLKNLEQITGMKLFSDVGHLFYGKYVNGQLTAIAKEGGRFLSASEVQDLYPFLDTSKYGDQAFLFPQDAGYVNPRLVVAAQQKVAKEQGCDIIDDVVESVEEESYQTDKEAVMKIITKSGNIFWSKRVLLCCGAFTQLKDLLPRDLELDLKVDGTFVVKLELGEEDVARLSTMPTGTSITDPELNCYFLPPIKYPDGKTYMKIGPGYFYQTRLTTLEDVKRWYLSAPNQEYVDKLKDIFLSIVEDD
ncbi:uncharacterized protein LOC117295657 [Asterias rubens]|uniref:uncharacterized protein LOC117295657 n=1 Tax=Asterias rubens TaxID=7604 RepID=UPI0014555686|nr:uncharacterized protein LOC117295657 [Asterias rubens]